jgi:hypothetical protein
VRLLLLRRLLLLLGRLLLLLRRLLLLLRQLLLLLYRLLLRQQSAEDTPAALALGLLLPVEGAKGVGCRMRS